MTNPTIALLPRPRLDTPAYLELSTEPLSGLITAAEREAAYQAALKFIDAIEPDTYPGCRITVHFRNKAGELLITLDEVVRAYIDNDLLLPEEAALNGN